jgi:signal transduction histidine kinase
VFPVSLSRSHIKDSDGNDVAIVGVARDITDRILIEDEIRTASLKLKQRNQAQSEIAIMVAETVQRLLAAGNVETAQRVISDHLDVSKIDTDKMELKPRQFDLVSLVSQAVEAMQPLATEHNIDLKNLTPSGELPVIADRDRIEQVLLNLLSRAIKSSAADSHVSVKLKDAGNEFSIEVQDDGPPLERNEIHRIVNRSDWIREQFNAGREDLALGLRLAKELVELHGGRIWAESSDARQNILCFTVPKSAVPHAEKVPVEMYPADAD